MGHQDVILDTPFSRHGQSDWLRSLKIVSRAQAMCWAAQPISDRQCWLKLAEAETEQLEKQSAQRKGKVLIHEQR